MTHWNPSRNPFGQFVPGSGGRPRGARNRAGRALRQVWEKSMEEHVEATIEALRQRDPAAYLRFLMKAVPTPVEDEVDPAEQLTPEEADQRLRDYAARLIAAGYGPQPERSAPGEQAAPSSEDAAGQDEPH